MTKKELADVVYNVHGGLSRKEAAAVVDELISVIKDSLVAGERVQISCFGVFEVQKKNKRKGINPLTKDKIEIPSHNAIVFRPSSYLKDFINKT
jgi:nucleoid DNA-binding protein